jgi:glycosyltransferase involved in cell wall biosynthesis
MTDRRSPHIRLKALLYADVDLNVIDGSSIWVASMAEVLAAAACDVTLLLKREIKSELVLEPILRHGGIKVIPPSRSGMTPQAGPFASRTEAAGAVRRLDRREHYDLIVVRGLAAALAISNDEALRGRLWTYLTDLPQSAASMEGPDESALKQIVDASRVMICQTEDMRSFLEHMLPAAAGRTMISAPTVPEPSRAEAREPLRGRAVRLVYTGKFAPRWKTLEMTGLPKRLADLGIKAELHAVGEKVHSDERDPDFHRRMKDALTSTPDVVWYEGKTRVDALAIAASGDIGLAWRDRSLDASLELSTKVLEYGSVGLPAVVNRTPMHERLLGEDYPLFASDEDQVIEVISRAVTDPSLLSEASSRCRSLAEQHTVAKAAESLQRFLERAFPGPLRATSSPRRLRIGVASHDFKFFTAILSHLRSLPDVEVRIDAWSGPRGQDLATSRALIDWADVVICEWCGPNAVWYSKHRRRGQRLIVRLHRYELDRPWPAQVEIDQVDRVICVSESYAAYTRAALGWPTSKIVVIPNWVDDAALDRPKLSGSRYNLGFIGMAPARKRLDRALDILESLRRRDPRFGLYVKTKMTWDYPGIWQRQPEREHVDTLIDRIQSSRLLRQSVVFDDFGVDVAAWLRRIGFVLSTSDDESFHLAPAEGMASGAVPMILDWPGADRIYDRRWIHHSSDEVAEDILTLVHGGGWEETRRMAQGQARADFGLDRVCAAWDDLMVVGADGTGRSVDERPRRMGPT